jgi:putative colanic acid biosysnthesis UDP-glucose lipid carrier transferase
MKKCNEDSIHDHCGSMLTETSTLRFRHWSGDYSTGVNFAVDRTGDHGKRWAISCRRIALQRPPLRTFERFFKRAFDICVASCGLLTLLPLLSLVAAAIKIDSPGPVFFRQPQHGLNGKQFKIFKFRSMSVLNDGETIKQATVGDSRVTRVGRYIRETSIDEIPQLLNVLRGEMSIIGPQPHAAAHDSYYLQQIEQYAFRQQGKPGITGLAQVHGYRGETRVLDQMRRQVEYDLWYIRNWSVWLDFVIILRTIAEVVR